MKYLVLNILNRYFFNGGKNIWQATKCLILRWEIWFLLHSDRDEIISGKVSRAIALRKLRYPNRSQIWYLEKTIEDLRNKY